MVNQFTRQYSFPNVSIRETVRGPQTFESIWRNTIGVAGPFNKGPLLGEVNTRQDFVNLYGEDDSLGSVAVRQAMLQGATNFIISRVLRNAKGSSGGLVLADKTDPTGAEATIGFTDDRTVGLEVDFSLITQPKVRDPNLVAYAYDTRGSRYILPETNSATLLPIDFKGIGNFRLRRYSTLWRGEYDFYMRYDENVNTVNTAALQFYDIDDSNITFTTTGTEVRLITIPKGTGTQHPSPDNLTVEFYLKALRGGIEFEGGTDGPTIASGQIIGEYFEVDVNTWGFYARLEVTATGVNNSIKLKIPSGTKTYPVIDKWLVEFIPDTDEVLDADQFRFETTYSQTRNLGRPYTSWLYLNRHDNLGTALPIYYYKEATAGNPAILDEITSGITYTVGAVEDTYANVVTSNQTITFAKDSVVIGETDNTDPLWPNTNRAFDVGTPISDIFKRLEAALYQNNLLNRLNTEVSINTDELPYDLTFTIGAEGFVGNSIIYTVSRFSQSVVATDLAFEDNAVDQFDANLNMVDGLDGVVPATRYFYSRDGEQVLFVEAISPGNSGNNVRVNIQPIDASTFILEVREEDENQLTPAPTESYYLSNYAIDVTSGIYPETLDSNLIRAYYVPALVTRIPGAGAEFDYNLAPLRVAPADLQGLEEGDITDVSFEAHPLHIGTQYLQNIPLQGGSEPEEYDAFIPEAAYIDAINRLEDQDCAFICAPGLIAGDIRYDSATNALVAQAQSSTPYNGLRIAVLSAPPQLTKSRAEILNQQYNSDRVVIVGGWSTLGTSVRQFGQNNTSPIGYYVGSLAVADTYISPAASSGIPPLNGVRRVDTNSSLEALDAFTNNNIEMIFLDSITNTPKFLNGRTTDSSIERRWVAIRRQADHIIMNLNANLQWAKSAPNTPNLRQQVASAADALLSQELRRGAISGYNRTVVDGSNPNRIAQGYLDVFIQWTPVFPADYISVDVVRTIVSQYTLQLSA